MRLTKRLFQFICLFVTGVFVVSTPSASHGNDLTELIRSAEFKQDLQLSDQQHQKLIEAAESFAKKVQALEEQYPESYEKPFSEVKDDREKMMRESEQHASVLFAQMKKPLDDW